MTPSHLFLHQHLEESARLRPDKIAVRDPDHAITFGELRSWAVTAAQALVANGVGHGSRVIMLMENSVDFAKVYWGVIYAGAVVTPLSPETKPDKLGWIAADCTPSAIVADDRLVEATREAIAAIDGAAPEVLSPAALLSRTDSARELPSQLGQVIDQDLGCIIYTSGSTGHPKGVMLSHQNLVTASRSVCSYLSYLESDSIFVAIPLTFDYGMHQLTMAALVGATVILERNFHKPLYSLDRLSKSRATVLPVVPSMVPMIDLLADRFDLSSVRLISSTAAALDPGKIDRLSALFPRAQIFSMYGLTECHRCTYLPPDELPRRKGSVGIAIPNTSMWVVDSAGNRHTRNATGELVIRGATVMKGYWNSPERTAQRLRPGLFPGEYVFYTGDVCRLDEDGFLYFVSRMDDVLKVKGEKVAPKEVEDALRRHPAVTEAIVFGRPDPTLGQSVHAAVTLRRGANATPEALRDWCANQLEAVAVPKSVEILDAFRLTTNGKIDRSMFMELS